MWHGFCVGKSPVMEAKKFGELLRQTYEAWTADKAPRLGAALSYYTVFSLSPMLVVVLGMVSLFVDSNSAQQELARQIEGTVGKDAAGLVLSLLHSSSEGGNGKSLTATLIGFATVILGAGALFGQLQDSLNTIWGVQPKPNQGIMFMIRERFISFAMVLGVGFLLIVSLLASTAIAALSNWMQQSFLPGPAWIFEVINVLVGLAVGVLLFAAIYKVLPDVEIEWDDVWIGAAVTAVLFTIGKLALGWYLGRQSVDSTYGAASSLVLLLLWVYYASQILFFGAEFTKVYAAASGTHILPSVHAETIGGGNAAPPNPAVVQPREKSSPERTPEAVHAKKLDRDYLFGVAAGAGMVLCWLVGKSRGRKVSHR